MKKILISLMAALLLLSGCQKKPPVTPSDERTGWSDITNDEQQAFADWEREWFVEANAKDYASMRFNMRNPADWGITDYEVSFGEMVVTDDTEYREKLEALKKFDRSKLNKDQQLMYDVIEFEMNSSIKMLSLDDDFDFMFTPNGGLNNNLITNLTELTFHSEQDVREFIELLKDTDRIIDEGIEYTKKQAKKGYVQADSVIDSIVEQVNRFLSAGDNNEIIVAFRDKVGKMNLAGYDGYEKQVIDVVQKEVVPAYKRIISLYKDLKGKCKTNGVMSDYTNGKEYYEAKLQNSLGTDLGVDEIADEVYDAVLTNINRILSVMSKMKEESGYAPEDVYEIMAKLQEASKADFPALEEINYTIDFLNPTVTSDNVSAYFVTPPYDALKDNVIKINPTFVQNDPDGLVSTLGHEGYPGHMYQHAYFDQNHPNGELKRIISYLGYGEGWAQYAGLKSYEYFCKDAKFIEYMQAFDIFSYCTYAYCDLMMHYHGWTVKDCADFYKQFYTEAAAESIAESIYETNLGDPGIFVSYAWGMVKMVNYHEEAQEVLGKKYSEIEFNRLILDVGNVPFQILDREVEEYLASAK